MSILYFQPTYRSKETANNVRYYIKENMDIFWDILKPLLPFIFACVVLDMIISAMMGIDEQTGKPHDFKLGELISSYFVTCLAISWHRVIIHGPDKFKAVNPFKPEKRDLAFIGMGIAIFVCAIIIGLIGGFISVIIHKVVLLIFLIAASPVSVFIITRLSFYFPSKATGADLTLKESFALSKGYVWKLLLTPILASWRIILLLIAYTIGAIILSVGISFALGASLVTVKLITVTFMLPIPLYATPLLTVFGITVLSNYYQYAMQHTESSKQPPAPPHTAELETPAE